MEFSGYNATKKRGILQILKISKADQIHKYVLPYTHIPVTLYPASLMLYVGIHAIMLSKELNIETYAIKQGSRCLIFHFHSLSLIEESLR